MAFVLHAKHKKFFKLQTIMLGVILHANPNIRIDTYTI